MIIDIYPKITINSFTKRELDALNELRGYNGMDGKLICDMIDIVYEDIEIPSMIQEKLNIAIADTIYTLENSDADRDKVSRRIGHILGTVIFIKPFIRAGVDPLLMVGAACHDIAKYQISEESHGQLAANYLARLLEDVDNCNVEAVIRTVAMHSEKDIKNNDFDVILKEADMVARVYSVGLGRPDDKWFEDSFNKLVPDDKIEQAKLVLSRELIAMNLDYLNKISDDVL